MVLFLQLQKDFLISYKKLLTNNGLGVSTSITFLYGATTFSLTTLSIMTFSTAVKNTNICLRVSLEWHVLDTNAGKQLS